MKFTRRDVLGSLALPKALRGAESARFADYASDFRVDLQETGPRVKLYDLRHLDSWRTPAEDFFTFHQTQSAALKLDDWRLEITGAVAKPPSEQRRRRDATHCSCVRKCDQAI